VFTFLVALVNKLICTEKHLEPSNMTSASFPFPVFIKKHFSVPSASFEVIFDVDAELHPPPPAEDTVVFSGLRSRSSMMAESTFMADRVGYFWRIRSIHREK
jgi:hypothetical protein